MLVKKNYLLLVSSENEGGIDKTSIFQLQFGCTCFHNFLATQSSFPANKRVIKAPLLEVMKQKTLSMHVYIFALTISVLQ